MKTTLYAKVSKEVNKVKINIFKRKITNEAVLDENKVEDVLLKAIMNGEDISRKEALTIPAVSSAVGLICESS